MISKLNFEQTRIIKEIQIKMSFLTFTVIFFFLVLKFVYSHRFVGDPCIVRSSESPGICKLFKDCEYAKKQLHDHHRYPQRCGFLGNLEIVCCPTRNPGEISKKKCKEYSRYVFETVRVPVLMVHPPKRKKNECGHNVVPLIVGGKVATRKEFPHMAAIGFETDSHEIKWLCGGTILSEQYVLTAAHCFFHSQYNEAKYVRIGVMNIFDNSTFKQVLKIANFIPHPSYNLSSVYNDIGLIKLEKPARLNSYARPACLSTDAKIPAANAIATGWGDTTDREGIPSDDLRKVTLQLVDSDTCNSSYTNPIDHRLKNGINDSTQVCAGSNSEEVKDTCQGDSGGPLQIYHVGDEIKCMYDIIGITSSSKFCLGNPGIYTRVSYFIKWIEDIVWP
ncbi:trypsin-3-like isoform X1 [Tenebrio molitor]|uniref:trypsin-3-like isoform X1 n=1 Tax=Tenebrio molitor TaxID=7067 RepID=UPI0036246ACA